MSVTELVIDLLDDLIQLFQQDILTGNSDFSEIRDYSRLNVDQNLITFLR